MRKFQTIVSGACLAAIVFACAGCGIKTAGTAVVVHELHKHDRPHVNVNVTVRPQLRPHCPLPLPPNHYGPPRPNHYGPQPYCPGPNCPPNYFGPPRASADEPVPFRLVSASEVPVINLPPAARQHNFGPSCVIASTIMVLRWQGLDEMAAYYRKAYYGAHGPHNLHPHFEKDGLRYAYTTRGDVAFLEWAIRTRRGSGICYFGNHYVLLAHLDSQWAGMIDNNQENHVRWVPRQEFIYNWQHRYHGWAATVVYTPPPPTPPST